LAYTYSTDTLAALNLNLAGNISTTGGKTLAYNHTTDLLSVEDLAISGTVTGLTLGSGTNLSSADVTPVSNVSLTYDAKTLGAYMGEILDYLVTLGFTH